MISGQSLTSNKMCLMLLSQNSSKSQKGHQILGQSLTSNKMCLMSLSKILSKSEKDVKCQFNYGLEINRYNSCYECTENLYLTFHFFSFYILRWMTQLKSKLIRFYWFGGQERLLTGDPEVFQHILVTNSKNYHRLDAQ